MYLEVLSSLFTLENLLWINVGLAGGIVVGALPGLTGTMAMALLLPLTYGLASIPGVMLLLGVYCGSIYGGSITAINGAEITSSAQLSSEKSKYSVGETITLTIYRLGQSADVQLTLGQSSEG